MTAPYASQIVDGYLARLRAAASALLRQEQDDLVELIAEHIAEARSALSHETDADILNILDRLGSPEELVDDAEGQPAQVQPVARRAGLLEIGALVLLPFLWPVGVILPWASGAWSWKDKLIGTLLPPGGYFSFLWLGVAYLGVGCGTSTRSINAHVVTHSTCGSSLAATVGIILFLALLILPIATGIYLGIRLRRPAPAVDSRLLAS